MDSNEKILLVLKSSMIGDNEPVLGEKLMKLFLQTLLEKKNYPAKIICQHTGIFLTTDGSPVLDILKDFEQNGTEILSCGTCLNYYNRTDKIKVGKSTNMKDTVDALLEFKRIIQP